MLSLVALIVVIVAAAASALPAKSHGWYAGLRSPSGMPCCNERDCHPVAARVNRDTGDEEIQANGAWYPVEYGWLSPPLMAATMPAGATRRDDPTFAASFFPAWPPSLRPTVQLESLLAFLFSPKGGLRRICWSRPGWCRAWNISATPNVSMA
jgi:hypothetical protein